MSLAGRSRHDFLTKKNTHRWGRNFKLGNFLSVFLWLSFSLFVLFLLVVVYEHPLLYLRGFSHPEPLLHMCQFVTNCKWDDGQIPKSCKLALSIFQHQHYCYNKEKEPKKSNQNVKSLTCFCKHPCFRQKLRARVFINRFQILTRQTICHNTVARPKTACKATK